MKKHFIESEFRNLIVSEIVSENKTIHEWAEIESDDMFQTEKYIGGFDATEMEFCFSYFDEKQLEYWFQISLNDIIRIYNNEINFIELTKADM